MEATYPFLEMAYASVPAGVSFDERAVWILCDQVVDGRRQKKPEEARRSQKRPELAVGLDGRDVQQWTVWAGQWAVVGVV